MIVAQEVWYITKGSYKHRKAYMVYYNVGNGGRQIVGIIEEGEPKPPVNNVVFLPSLEVTPSQFKWFTDKKRGKTA